MSVRKITRTASLHDAWCSTSSSATGMRSCQRAHLCAGSLRDAAGRDGPPVSTLKTRAARTRTPPKGTCTSTGRFNPGRQGRFRRREAVNLDYSWKTPQCRPMPGPTPAGLVNAGRRGRDLSVDHRGRRPLSLQPDPLWDERSSYRPVLGAVVTQREVRSDDLPAVASALVRDGVDHQ